MGRQFVSSVAVVCVILVGSIDTQNGDFQYCVLLDMHTPRYK